MSADSPSDSPLPRVLREGSVLAWHNLLTLVWLNVLWVVCAATLVLAGPATLTAYGYLAALRDDEHPVPRQLLERLRRTLLPGTLCALTTVAFGFLAYANLQFWPQVLGQFGLFVVGIFWGYLIWLFAAAQPYLLEALSVQRLPYVQAWQAALLDVARRPLSAHGWVLIPLALALLGLTFRTPGLVVLVSLLLTYAAVQVRPVTIAVPPLDPPQLEEGEEVL
ncbi:DUF624 domain-containing protein [Deinococcus saxicola]|uniref:DUF624 domain-containing protein n=1 Tax=Deinococcus saxicola TaxID=249406 RepID=UPI0039F081B7